MSSEAHRSFACFGGTASLHVGAAAAGRAADAAAVEAEARLLEAHDRLSRFIPGSELCRLNADSRMTVPVSGLLLEVAASARRAGLLSGGLVDATLRRQIEQAGYGESLAGKRDRPGPGRVPASDSPQPATASANRGWSRIHVDRGAGTVSRPPGVEDRQRRDRQGPSGRSRRGKPRRTFRLSPSTAAATSALAARAAGRAGSWSRIRREEAPSTSSRSATAASRPAGSAAAPGSETTAGRRITCSIPRPEGPPSPG